MMKTKALLVISFMSAAATCLAQKEAGNLVFNSEKYQPKTLALNDKELKVRAYEKIIYVENPVDTAYQIMNIYIPEAYFEGKSINGYTAENAPVFFPNQIGGYMPGKPATTEARSRGMMPPLNGQPPQERQPEMRRPDGGMGGPKSNTVLEALFQGYVVASAGARGRTQESGKAPAVLVDLKAAIRYLKANDKRIPGDANKIVSNGTSAGGALSTLLGATGNSPDYEPYLKALGAAPARDDVFAVSAYCPITNLDHADMAYEWQFQGINTYQKRGPMAAPGQDTQSLTSEQIARSNDLKNAFPAYVNSLKLKDKKGHLLTLEANGHGSFQEWVKSYVVASAQKALKKGADLSIHHWLTISGGKVTELDWDKYLVYMERQKTPPAFDALDLSSPENQVFGNEKNDKQHFTKYGKEHSTVAGSTLADQPMIKMMNPMDYLGEANMQPSKHWRIRHGSKDKDTGLAISVILATQLQNKGYDVNLEFPWDKPHSGDYDLPELFQWIDTICR